MSERLAALAASGNPCAIHKTHTPTNLTVEFHHIIPVAWQLHTTVPPASQPSPGPDLDGRGMLWDDRGTWLCPTGHRNVHTWIVRLMHAIASLKADDPTAAYAQTKPKHAPKELPVALEALTRFEPFGSLLALTEASQWGQS